MEIATIIFIVTGVISGASAILKAIAPYTVTKKDDKVSAFLVKVLEVLSLHTETKK